jgi:predicted DNA-binding transcriptional regulator AlpA
VSEWQNIFGIPSLRLKEIVNNRMTLRRWIAENGFPPGVQLGPNSVAWPADEVQAWLASRQRRHLQVEAA